MKLILKILLWFLVTIFSLFVVVFFLLKIPAVQRKTVSLAEEIIYTNTGARTDIGTINLRSPKSIEVTDITIYDQDNKIIFETDQLTLGFSLSDLFKKKIQLNDIHSENTSLNLYRSTGHEDFNFSFLLNKKKPGKKSTWKVGIGNVYLRNIKTSFKDNPKKKFLNGKLGEAQILFSAFDTDNSEFTISRSSLENLDIDFVNSITEAIKESATGEKKNWKVKVNFFTLKNSAVKYNLTGKPILTHRIDWNHLNVICLNTSIRNVILTENMYEGIIKELSLNEQSGFEIKNVDATVLLNKKKLNVEATEIETSGSLLDGETNVTIPDISEAGNAPGEITGFLNLEESHINLKDIYLLTGIKKLPDAIPSVIYIEGNVSGKLNNLSSEGLTVGNGKSEIFDGSFRIHNLPDWKKSRFDITVNKFSYPMKKLISMVSSKQGKASHGLTGSISYKGKVKGTIASFSTKGNVLTNVGSAPHNLTIRLNDEFKLKSISGNVSLKNVNLGKITNNTNLGFLNSSFTIISDSKKFSLKNGEINSAEINKYTYRNIQFTAAYTDSLVEADIICQDTNASGKFCGVVKLNREQPLYSFESEIAKLDLQSLHLATKPLIVSGKVSAAGSGINPDSIEGFLIAEKIVLSDNASTYTLDSLNLNLTNQADNRIVELKSSIGNINLEGDFRLTQLPGAAKHLLSHYYSGISAEKIHIDNISFGIKLFDTRIISRFFIHDLKDASEIIVKGSYDNPTHLLNAYAFTKKIIYQDHQFENIEIEIKGDKQKLVTHTRSTSADIAGRLHFTGTEFNTKMFRDSLLFDISTKDTLLKSSVNIAGTTLYLKEKYYTTINTANIVLRQNIWTLEGQPQIVAGKNLLDIDNFHLKAAPEQEITINSSGKKVFTEISNVRIDEMLQLAGLNYTLKGKISGKGNLINQKNGIAYDGDFSLENIEYEKIKYGTALFNFSKSAATDLVQTEVTIKNNRSEIRGTGEISIAENGPVNISLNAANLPVSDLQPFVKNQIYKLQGIADIRAGLTGTLNNPDLRGYLKLKDKHTIGLVLTNTEYFLENQLIEFEQNKVNVDNLILKDKFGSEAHVNGFVSFQNLTDPSFDIHMKADDFVVVNSSVPGGLPFYGNINADLDVTISGTLSETVIQLDAATNKNSEIIIGLNTQTTGYGTPDFIQFKTDTSATKDKKPKESNKKKSENTLKINGTVSVSDNALVNLIVDPVNGDKISSRGEGKFKFDFNTNSDFNIFGTYTISEGKYTFTFLDLVRRDFSIAEGSTVSWIGDLEKGLINLKAYYQTNASRLPLISDQRESLSPEELSVASRKLPVKIIMNLTGEYMKPDITFDIEVPENEQDISNGLVNQRINDLKENPTELNKQVLGVIAFNQFMPYQGFALQGTAGGESIASQSVSQLLNSQIGKITNQISGLDLEVNLNSGNQILNQNVNVRATTKITERLSISVGGDFASGTQPNAGSVFLGDYILYYRLNSKGSLRVKVFSRGQQNIYTDSFAQISGMSMQYSRSFDSFGKKKENEVPQ